MTTKEKAAFEGMREALKVARHSLTQASNLLVTDRPDLPSSTENHWTSNFTPEIEAIDKALALAETVGV